MSQQVPQPARVGPQTIGILGGGQLGRMMAISAVQLGLQVRFYEPADSGPVAQLGTHVRGDWDDREAISKFLEGCDLVTLENEWAGLDCIDSLLPAGVKMLPSRECLAKISDKLVQKRHAQSSEIPVGDFRACDSLETTRAAAEAFGFPVVLKRLRHGYDGYGTRVARDAAALEAAYGLLADDAGVVLVEAWVPFERELSVVLARRSDGTDAVYPIAFTRQEDNRCTAVEVPAQIPEAVASRAIEVARATARAFDVVGVMAVELFELASGEVLFNEIAPRPHNSGHYTIDACMSSQFDNHIRAVMGWPLGDTSLVRPASVMVNLLGEREGEATPTSIDDALAEKGVYVHLYGKREVRPQRKMGHVTAVGDDLDEVRERALRAAAKVQI